MHPRSLIFFAVISLTILPARADLSASDPGPLPMTTLPGPWRFHAGDDPSWSNATFDDSSWSRLDAGEPWSRQGYSGYSGVAWYRLRLTLPPHQALSLLISRMSKTVVRFSPMASLLARSDHFRLALPSIFSTTRSSPFPLKPSTPAVLSNSRSAYGSIPRTRAPTLAGSSLFPASAMLQ